MTVDVLISIAVLVVVVTGSVLVYLNFKKKNDETERVIKAINDQITDSVTQAPNVEAPKVEETVKTKTPKAKKKPAAKKATKKA